MFPWAVLPTETTKRPGSNCEGRCQVGDHIKSMLSWGEADNAIDIGRKVSHPHWLKSDGKLFWWNYVGDTAHEKHETLEDVVYNFGHGMFFFVMKFRSCPIKCWDSMGNSCGLLLGNGFVYTIGWPWISPKCILMIHQVVSPNMLDLKSRKKLGKLGGGNSNIFYFHPENWGRFPILTPIFQVGWLKPPTRKWSNLTVAYVYRLEATMSCCGICGFSRPGAHENTNASWF